jgi:hypothetical protein
MSFHPTPAKNARRYRRVEASTYLKQAWGLSYSPKTLAKLAVQGGGPAMIYAGRIPLYGEADLDAWASAKIGAPVTSTSQRRQQLAAA